MEEKVRAGVSNPRVAADLGISESMVSRIRSGDRLPSIQLVRKIATVYGWPVAEQIEDLDPGRYAVAFEDLLRRRYE